MLLLINTHARMSVLCLITACDCSVNAFTPELHRFGVLYVGCRANNTMLAAWDTHKEWIQESASRHAFEELQFRVYMAKALVSRRCVDPSDNFSQS